MAISVIVGPPNSGRAVKVRERLEACLERDPVLVVPTGDDAARFERELCEPRGAVVGLAIRTFGSLFEDAARAAGLRLPPPLTAPQRLALLRAATTATPLRLLARSARRPGFVPALEGLIGELEAALVAPAELAAAAAELDDGDYELELTALYGAYVDLRDRAGRSDAGSRAAATLSALSADPGAWGDRPVFVYGFDDLTRAQLELVAALGEATEVVAAVNYDDREALVARAGLLAQLREELGATVADEVEHDPTYTEVHSLRHLDRHLFEPGAPAVESDGGVVMLECAGELGEAEAIGAEVARLLADGIAPDEIAIVVRDAARRAPALGRILERLEIPVAIEASMPLDHTAVGRSLAALCRAASPQGTPDDLLAHLRSDPDRPPGIADALERTIRRRRPETVDEAISSWGSPPRHLTRLRAATGAAQRMRTLASIARELAEAPHDKAAPAARGERADGNGPPFEPLELRAAAVAAELCGELAEIGELPGCDPPDLTQALEAIEAASVPLWRGPTDGRVRLLDPYRMRAGRARYLFCATLQEGEFPRRVSGDPLLSDERRRGLGIGSLIRRDPHEEERYLFHACISRPTERLYLSWQYCDDDGAPAARSPFVDEVLDLLGIVATERVPIARRRGLERVVFEPSEAPTERQLARSEALAGPRVEPALPGPLVAPPVLAELSERRQIGASTLESWLECPYRWFVDHELRPQRLDPVSDSLRLGTVAHNALERLYRDPPGSDSIPRPGDLARWKQRLGELIEEVAIEERLRPDQPPDSVALARLRAQIARFLEEEAELETELRPRPELLEASFGFEDEDCPEGLDLGGATLHGRIDRVDVAPDGAAVVRDYKTSAKVPGRKAWEDQGKLQLQLYVLAARERLDLDPIGGLYHALGDRDKRKPRGMVVKDDPRLEGLPMVSTDGCEPDEFEAELERARAQAAQKAAAMRAGDIDRDPRGGVCPTYCTFQPICRLERAIGLEEVVGEGDENGNGNDSR
jgi:RecB family exonuclease